MLRLALKTSYKLLKVLDVAQLAVDLVLILLAMGVGLWNNYANHGGVGVLEPWGQLLVEAKDVQFVTVKFGV